MTVFKDDDKVLIECDGSYLDGIRATLYSVTDTYGHIEYDDKVWVVPFTDMTLVCRKHRRYQAKRKPTSGCETCLRIYEGRNE